MFQRDYIMRMIEMMTAGIANILGLRQQRKHDEALAAIHKLLKRTHRMNGRLIRSLSAKDLKELHTANGMIEAEKLISLGTLLKLEGDIHADKGEEAQSVQLWNKSLYLLLAGAVFEHDSKLLGHRESISDLIHCLAPWELPSDTLVHLFRYEEYIGHYAKAENILYELLDRESDRERPASSAEAGFELPREGAAFYERLLDRDDSMLLAGQLPRQEVLDGLEDWTNKTNQQK